MVSDFERYLMDRHAEQYCGLDDEMADDFFDWSEGLAPEQWMKYANDYSSSLYVQGMEDCRKLMKRVETSKKRSKEWRER